MRDGMRTTLDLEDGLEAGRALARRQRRTMGAVVSDLMRAALHRAPATEVNRNGITVLSQRGLSEPVTMAVVNRLRDELP